MFSGQGSQYYQMGSSLFQGNSTFKGYMNRLDERVQQQLGISPLYELYHVGRKATETFDHLPVTHLSIFMVEYSLASTLMNEGIIPDYVLGTSLGEFAAAAVAGIITADQAVDMLVTQVRYIEENCEQGGMLAILGNPAIFSQVPSIYEKCSLVSENYNMHFVISGSTGDLEKVAHDLDEQHILSVKLPVRYAFHSPMLSGIGSRYKTYLNSMNFQAPQISFISSLYGKEISRLPEAYFWNVIRYPILFRNALSGMEQSAPHLYIDVGPSGTLATMVKYNLAQDSMSQQHMVLTPYGRAEFNNIENLKQTLMLSKN
nr:acyltransferase domain-containing protein [Paenibacillus monticola]